MFQWASGGLVVILWRLNLFPEVTMDLLAQFYGSISGLFYLSLIYACIYSTLNEKQMETIATTRKKKSKLNQLGLD